MSSNTTRKHCAQQTESCSDELLRPDCDHGKLIRYIRRMDWRSRITIEAGKRGGKPCIRGLRMTVYDILEYLASGMREEEILTDFPDLEHEDILAALAFAAERERKVARPPAA